jgi:phosphate transport system permease protein
MRKGIRWDDLFVRGASWAGALWMLALLILMIWVLLWGSSEAMKAFGWKFLGETEWDPVKKVFGAFPSILGTVVCAALALLIAVPVSIGSAIFMVQILPKWRARIYNGLTNVAAEFEKQGASTGGLAKFGVLTIRAIGTLICDAVPLLIELLAAIPSIAFGLWGKEVLVPVIGKFTGPASEKLGQLQWWSLGKNEFGVETFFPGNLFATDGGGYGLLTAAIILAVMCVPIITAVTRDVLRVVPADLEQGAIGLGATWWQATKVMLSFARGGIFGAIILGLARALGETMAVAMVMNLPSGMDYSIFGNWTTITTNLANKFQDSEPLAQSALIYLALILLVITVLVNLLARFLVSGVARKKVK